MNAILFALLMASKKNPIAFNYYNGPSYQIYFNWAIRAEVMRGRTFLSPLKPPAKTPAPTDLIKRKTLLFTLHIALESIPQLKCSALQLMMNHDVYLDKYAWSFILFLHPVICVDVDHQVIFLIKPSPPLKKEKLRN